MGQWVMGHSFDWSHGSWVTARDPFAALIRSVHYMQKVLILKNYTVISKPDIRMCIGFSSFSKHCVFAGSSGTHSVCV